MTAWNCLSFQKKYSPIMNAAKTIVATVEADAATANMPAVKERLNMLKETISDAETPRRNIKG